MPQKPIVLKNPIPGQSELPPHDEYQDTAVMPVVHPSSIPQMIKLKEHVVTPRFNMYYDSQRTTQGWRHTCDGLARGSIATTVNATVQTPVVLTTTPNWRLEQWPGAVQLYLAVRFFAIAPQAIPTTNAAMEVLFYDQFGNIAPLGEVMSQVGINANYNAILPTAITDPGNQTVGTLSISLPNTATSNGTYSYSIGFSALYLLPARFGYEVLQQERYESRDWSPRPGGHPHEHSGHEHKEELHERSHRH